MPLSHGQNHMSKQHAYPYREIFQRDRARIRNGFVERETFMFLEFISIGIIQCEVNFLME